MKCKFFSKENNLGVVPDEYEISVSNKGTKLNYVDLEKAADSVDGVNSKNKKKIVADNYSILLYITKENLEIYDQDEIIATIDDVPVYGFVEYSNMLGVTTFVGSDETTHLIQELENIEVIGNKHLNVEE